MAFEFLTPGAQGWRNAGLTHILQPDVPIARPANQAPPAPKKPAMHPKRLAPNKVQPAVVAPGRTEPDWKPVSIEFWPEIWQERFRNTRRGKIAWTYWNLGADLTAGKGGDDADAQARKQRSQFIGRLIKDLGHPAGTHTFWPLHLDKGSEPEINPNLFWSALTALGCRGVIIMGSRAAQPLLKRPGLRPLMQVREKGHIAWILRDIDGFPEEEYGPMLNFLRQSLFPIVRR